MATDSGATMAASLSKFRVAVDRFEEAKTMVASRFDAATSLALAYQSARERYQREVWASRGKRLCPRCGKVRGARTFKWVMFLIPERPAYVCRACWRGAGALTLEGDDLFAGDRYVGSVRDRGTMEFAILRWNDEHFTVGEDMKLPEI